MTTHIKLRGDRGKQFERLKNRLAEKLGYEPTNPEVLGHMMGSWDDGSFPPLQR